MIKRLLFDPKIFNYLIMSLYLLSAGPVGHITSLA